MSSDPSLLQLQKEIRDGHRAILQELHEQRREIQNLKNAFDRDRQASNQSANAAVSQRELDDRLSILERNLSKMFERLVKGI